MKISKEYVRDGKTVAVSAEHVDGDRWRVRVGEATYEYHATALGDGGIRLAPVGQEFERSFTAYGAPAGKQFMVRVNGRTHTLASPAARAAGAGRGADGTIRAPMTGTVLDVSCKPGDVVEPDQTLVVLSAMKMEHKLCAGLAGVVQSVAAKKGGTVEQGAA
ncbi:MAG: biotin/lipoyl-containing protein, partial [Planctomycetota bacterium]|nr:biotin/lipoyl-containing protein [Planctomycetota bacterium]